MQFAINYSPQAAALLNTGDIEIDLFKCPDWHNLTAEAATLKPIYIHFPLRLGNDSLKNLDFDEVEAWRSRTGTRYVNTHLGIARDIYADVHADALVDYLLAELAPLIDRFGAENIIIENIPLVTRLMAHYRPECINSDLIYSVVEQSGCGLLLDISHAVLSCQTYQLDFEDYIARLPMHRLSELHITGIGLNQEGQVADHLPMQNTDWTRLEWVLEQIRVQKWRTPDIMAFEYGGIGSLFDWRSESDVIAEQVPRLYTLTQTMNQEPVLS